MPPLINESPTNLSVFINPHIPNFVARIDESPISYQNLSPIF
jgi:hypothetical protein